MLWKQVMDRFGKKNLWVVGLSAVVMAGVAWIAVPLAKSHRHPAPAPPARRLSLRPSRPQPRWRDALGTAGRMPALHQSVLGMEFVGAQDQAEIAGIDLVPGVSNYFIGDDPHRWATGVPHYSRVRYRGIYPGVNLEFRSNGPELGLGFIVEAGADPGLIHLR